MLDARIESALNKQINYEFAAAYNYLATAAYFERQNLTGFAHWMYTQRTEEEDHAMRLYRYVIDRGGKVELGAIAKPVIAPGSIREVFVKALDMERENTKGIYDLYSLANDLKDYATMSHLKWFLDEQVEEEKIMEEVIGLMDFAGADKGALLTLNRQFGERAKAQA